MARGGTGAEGVGAGWTVIHLNISSVIKWQAPVISAVADGGAVLLGVARKETISSTLRETGA